MSTPLEDIRFTIEAIGTGSPLPEWDVDATMSVLESLAGFADTVIASTNVLSDQEGCRLIDGRVHMPASSVSAYQEYVELGWHLLSLPENHGGVGAPPLAGLAANEILCGANPAFQMVTSLVSGASEAIIASGTAEQQDRLVPELASGESLATMCLTEPGAGSDLGAIKMKASQNNDGTWRLNGEKIFISGGDQNLTPRILHLVLARTGSTDERTRGLSLFACPSHLPDGTRNDISVVRIEEKLGLHGSPTCQLSFDNAQAELIGNPGDGLKAMFVMMNNARLEVALQGVAMGSKAARLASEYAASREQGGKPIAQHPDVDRMLMEMDALTMGARAMAYRTAVLLENADLASFLTPVCKVFGSEIGSQAADLGMQVLGGYGYLPEYGIEQIWRDGRITRIYEGTNGILSMTLATRLLNIKDGHLVSLFLDEIDDSMTDAPAEAITALQPLKDLWHQTAKTVQQNKRPGYAAVAFMKLTGLVFFAASWGRLERHAAASPHAARISRLARFVRAHILPEAQTLSARCMHMMEHDWQDR